MFLLVANNSTSKADSLELSSVSAATSIDIDIVEEEEEEEVINNKRVKIQRKAKSIAKEAITSILLPHYNNNNNSDTKIDQSNSIPSSIDKQEQQQRDRSRSTKRRRSSTISSQPHNLRSSRKSTSNIEFDNNQQPSTSTRRSTRNSIPNKKAKLNSDINNNLDSNYLFSLNVPYLIYYHHFSFVIKYVIS
jgi:hypothetical protein